jgi:hypothetical protein
MLVPQNFMTFQSSERLCKIFVGYCVVGYAICSLVLSPVLVLFHIVCSWRVFLCTVFDMIVVVNVKVAVCWYVICAV